tara:strand:+ start:728 stop:1873 length:1146 start_codon:yes stop_codon:yes gene_type:complete
MKRRFKFKISGESPRSLLLAFVLSKFECDIYLYNFLRDSNSNEDYQILSFSNFSKNLFNKFDTWKELKDFSYGVTSLHIKDNLVSDQLLLRNGNCCKKEYASTIGWIINYSNIKSLLINKLINVDNVHFISKNQKHNESLIFDYEFNFYSHEKFLSLFKLPLSISKRIDNQVLIFDVFLRGNVEKRLYEINTTEGLVVLTPLNKHSYQIIWNNASLRIKERALSSKSLFLDNLTSLLPNELQIDQIIGDIKFFYYSNVHPAYLIKNKSIYFNESKLKSNTLYDINFDIVIKNILQIYKYLDNNTSKRFKILCKLRFYFLRKYLGIILKFSFSNYLINLFTVNSIFSLYFRKLLFILFKRIILLKNFFMRNISYLNIDNLIK